ncbi:MAG TPA: IPT/TIG domain-containing protein, partial [Thermomicrobiales bacterium]
MLSAHHYFGRQRVALRRWLVLTMIASLLLSLVPLTAQVALAANITVNTFADTLADDGLCSLREAIIVANNDSQPNLTPGECAAGSGADIITVPAGTYVLTKTGTGENAASSGDLDIISGSDITILGAGAGMTIIDGNAASGSGERVFDVRSGGILTIGSNVAGEEGRGLSIRGGVVNGLTEYGGGIRTAGAGAVTLNDSEVAGNSVAGGVSNGGGGIYHGGTGTLTVRRSTIRNNTVTIDGGGLYVSAAGGGLLVEESTVAQNSAGRNGGGIYTNSDNATIARSTISGNIAGASQLLDIGGGGLYNEGNNLTITNSTISGNTVPGGSVGGGLHNQGGNTLNLINSTVAFNSTGIRRDGGTVNVLNSIIANSTAGANCSGTITNGGNNADSGASCGFGVPSSDHDLQLGPLTVQQPGRTATHAPNPSSYAVGLVPAADVNCVGTDQRGVPRPQGMNCDAGAVEVLANPSITTLVPSSGPTNGGIILAIVGTGFQSNLQVLIGGVECAGANVTGGTVINGAMIDGTQIACDLAPNTVGAKDVTIVNPDGGTTINVGAFTYVAPTITSITPNSGPSNGGTPVTIVGTGFQPGAMVTIGVAPCQAVLISGNGTEITCTTPAGPVGTADVVVTNPYAPFPDGTAELVAGFSYLSPSQASFSPASVAFGNQEINTTSVPQVVTLTNTGTTVLNVSGVAITGGNAADFAIVPGSDTCTGAALAFNAHCTVSVRFTPTATQARGAGLTFTNDSNGIAGSQQNILLSGIGTPTPLPNFTITVSKSGPGEVQPGTGALVYQQGANAALTAVPNADAVLIGWTVDGTFVGFGNPLTFPVTKD